MLELQPVEEPKRKYLGSPNYNTPRYANAAIPNYKAKPYAIGMWQMFRPIFIAAANHSLRHDDPGLIEANQRAGRKGSSVTPILTELVRAGKIGRISRGLYRMLD